MNTSHYNYDRNAARLQVKTTIGWRWVNSFSLSRGVIKTTPSYEIGALATPALLEFAKAQGHEVRTASYEQDLREHYPSKIIFVPRRAVAA